MSTKIYNGYKLPKMSAYQLRAFVTKLREKLHPIAIKLIAQKIAEDCTDNLDDMITGRILQKHYLHRFTEEGSKSRYALQRSLHSNVEDRLTEKFRKVSQSMNRNPSYDFQFSVTFMPMRNAVYATIYTEQQKLTKAWEKMDGVQEYPYWDNTDQPKGMTLNQWKKRGKQWDEIMRDSPPMTFGLSFELLNTTFFMIGVKKEMILKQMPTKKERAVRCAGEKVMGIKMKAYQRKNKINLKKITLTSETGYFVARDFCRSEAGKKMIADYAKKYMSVLPNITEKILNLNYYEIKKLRKK